MIRRYVQNKHSHDQSAAKFAQTFPRSQQPIYFKLKLTPHRQENLGKHHLTETSTYNQTLQTYDFQTTVLDKAAEPQVVH